LFKLIYFRKPTSKHFAISISVSSPISALFVRYFETVAWAL